MIHKKRGQGAGKWNFPGGKVTPQESSTEGAIRETIEETGIQPFDLTPVGDLTFFFEKIGNDSWNNQCQVFISEKFSGSLIPETEECSAKWVKISEIPYPLMWETDEEWVPLALQKIPFSFEYLFDENSRILHRKKI